MVFWHDIGTIDVVVSHLLEKNETLENFFALKKR
jgi:hypothetical protein